MSFGQPFPPYASALHNSQFLLAAAAAASSIGSGYNSLNVISRSDSSRLDTIPSTATSSTSLTFSAAPASSSSAKASFAGGNLLAVSAESGQMSSDSLRVLASSAGHHIPPPPVHSTPQSMMPPVPSQPGAGHPLAPMFGMPSLDPYRLPPPPFGLYSGGISPAGGPLDLKMPDGLPPPPFAHSAATAITPFYYDPAFGSGYPYAADRFGNPLDLNGARRKNATRETTAALKAWLYEHRKNPYPTKGEKIMLAIITKMTLTQVSTWFANARRRLKKENKMTWSPRNRPGEDDDGADGNSTTQENSGAPRPGSSLSSLGDDIQDGDEDDDIEDSGVDTVAGGCNLSEEGAKQSVHGSRKSGEAEEKSEASGSLKRLAPADEPPVSPKKHKIWSIAETVASPDASPQKMKPPSVEPAQPQQQQQGPYHFTFPPWPHMAAAAAFAGRSPLMQPPNSASNVMGPSFPFGAPAPFVTPASVSSLPHPHQLRPEMFARNFFSPVPPNGPMMNAAAAAAAATGLPGFFNGFSFGCGTPAFPFGFGLPVGNNVSNAAFGMPAVTSQPQAQSAACSGAGGTVGDCPTNQQQAEAKSQSATSISPVSSNGGRKSSNCSREPKTNAS